MWNSAGQLLLQKLIELRRIGLAAGGLHDLADEEAEQLVFARAVVGKLARILRHDRVDGLLDGTRVGDLLEAPGFDDGIRVLAFGPHRLEYILGDLARDGVVDDARQQAGQTLRVDAALGDLEVVLVERRGERTGYPVG